ncbi:MULTISPECIES: hypothetical protein [Bacillus]|uniref:hypothetical protein n=1 Tax=Bacillus TaxID=1386 RepID=UPI00036877A7|nr:MULTISPECIES: hypothetical protein [Bacillus]
MKYILFCIAVVLLISTLYFFVLSLNAGVYPNKYSLQRRAILLGIGAVLFFLIGIILK